MEIILENVRSFCERHVIPIKPLTLLLGENSTGKTTFLSMIAHVTQAGFSSLRPSFNAPPFDLGTFDSIATFKGGRYGRADSFSVGFDSGQEEDVKQVVATYVNYMGQAQLSKFLVSAAGRQLTFEVTPDITSARVSFAAPGGAKSEFQASLKRALVGELPVIYFLRNLIFEHTHARDKVDMPLEAVEILSSATRNITPVFALAPVRTKPRRTYDEISDEFKPEGDHIPVMLARISQEEADVQKDRLFEALNDFGESSSLFRNIGVRRLGKRPSDPFQILVTTAGPAANLPDVGYGVSQALPVVVQSVLGPRQRTLLLQQPEVHLHPRGQAALGSFFSKLVKKEKRQFVIETHSDYLVDRVRQEVARGTLPADDVLILFFEKEEIETRVHQIRLDRSGNLVGTPPEYRRFFLEEELTLLGRTNANVSNS